MPALGHIIRSGRKAKGLTQSELADLVGVSEQAVRKWELSRSAPRSATVKRLSEVLDLPESAFNPYGDGGLTVAGQSTVSNIPLIEWQQLADIDMLNHDSLTNAEHVRIEVPSENPVQAGEYRMIVADDSMAPEYRPGEILRLSINVQPWDGCTVAAVVGAARTPVLRYYRERGNGSFDLWPENPNFQPVTANASMQIDIKGVVVRHVRSFEPPAQ